jgi:hypothetical protein
MNKQIILGLASLALFGAVACSGDDTTTTPTPDAGSKDTSSPDAPVTADSGTDAAKDSGPSTPPPPVLGAQIDRIGRPAVNTAANNTFNPDANAAGKAKDAYNADTDPTAWVKNYGGEVAKNLAIYDGLDTNCGNQLLAGQPGPMRYAGLAGALSDDRLYVNTGNSVCGNYLAVELTAVMVPGLDKDCGGRTLTYDVIDATYNAVAGTPPGTLVDGISADPVKTGGKAFPYLVPAK